ncbi:hypothetical protein QMT05_15060 [Cronobacter malonaticus]|uniref:hypothetical protein n=1 Tax=Cronobacter malonaticus TaxID=413503 RepID=UPI0024C35D1B|nr:hypothetical protein [Cronobacter malonaticus]MDK1178367.1 hypothetical protein [Cronobacter malonaticus]MDK1688292.1 hypothetical protein [Cronobacter malonaticus]
MSTISNERLEELRAMFSPSANKDVYLALGELLALRKERERAEPKPGRNPVLAYADSYREMAKRGVESIPVWSVITDLERNIAPLYTAPPAPVVPEEVLKSLDLLLRRSYFRRWVKDPQGYVAGSIPVRDLVNVVLFADACRAAILNQSQPVAETDTTSQQFESLAGKAVGEDASSMADAHMAWLNTNFPRNAYSDEEWEEVSLYTWLAWRDSQRNACFPGT